MANLIIHVGPGKCGSSSIQHFFETKNQPCVQKTHYIKLNPLEINELNCEKPDSDKLATFTELLLGNLAGCDVLILSHEYLFDCPDTIKNICIAATNLVSEILIIGYSRRQSDFIVSAYSQWLFFMPDRVREVANVLIDLHLNPILFSGLERQLIASIANDFYSARQPSNKSILDWNNSYHTLLQLVRESCATIKCGTLPKAESGVSLIRDFCEKSGLTLRKETETLINCIVNTNYNHDLVEMVNNAVAFCSDVSMSDEQIYGFCQIFAKWGTGKSRDVDTEFLFTLKAYIDTYFLNSNNQLCGIYGLSKQYFSPSMQYSKHQIFEVIRNEAQNRSLNPTILIDRVRMLSAKFTVACLERFNCI